MMCRVQGLGGEESVQHCGCCTYKVLIAVINGCSKRPEVAPSNCQSVCVAASLCNFTHFHALLCFGTRWAGLLSDA